MPYYSYWIRTREGKTSQGHREAADAVELRAWLEARGLLVLSIIEARRPTTDPDAVRLGPQDSEAVLTELAELQKARLPLAQGLRVAAQVPGRRRLTRAMSQIAQALDEGVEWDDAVARVALPEHHRGLLLAAQRSQRPAEVLLSVFEQEQLDREVRSSIRAAVAYPLILLAFTLIIFCGTMLVVVRPFRQIFLEYQLKLPLMTELVLWWSDTGAWVVMGFCLMCVGAAAATRATLGPARWHQLLITVPFLGPLWQWSGAAQFTRLLSIMLSHEVPLPDALRFTGLAARQADLREQCQHVAYLVENGERLSAALDVWPLLPEVVPLYVRWGEQHRSLADALRAASDMLAGRVYIHASALRTCLPPMILVLVLILALAIVTSLFLPMYTFLRAMM